MTLIPETLPHRGGLAALTLTLALVGAGTIVAKDADFARHGRALYVQYCVACHGPGGRGDGPAAGALKSPVPDLTQLARKYGEFPVDRVMIWIDGEKASAAHGTREMPVWGRQFRRQGGAGNALGEVYALMRYLQTIQK
jgi:mono/diheme cytochrome c family protein